MHLCTPPRLPITSPLGWPPAACPLPIGVLTTLPLPDLNRRCRNVVLDLQWPVKTSSSIALGCQSLQRFGHGPCHANEGAIEGDHRTTPSSEGLHSQGKQPQPMLPGFLIGDQATSEQGRLRPGGGGEQRDHHCDNTLSLAGVSTSPLPVSMGVIRGKLLAQQQFRRSSLAPVHCCFSFHDVSTSGLSLIHI